MKNIHKKWNAAVIGIGRIGFTLEKDALRGGFCTHSAAYLNHPDFNLVSVADINFDRRKEFAAYYNFDTKKIYPDYRLMLTEEKIDVVSIATWTDTHKEIFLDCVKNPDIKIIFLEKPISLNLRDSQNMISAARRQKKIVAVNYERRWDANYIKIKEIIANNELGELRTITGNVLTGTFPHAKWHKKILKRGGPLLHDGVHIIDILLFFCGNPLKYKTELIKFNKTHKYEHTAYIDFTFKNGVKAFVEIGGRRKYFNFELDLQFEAGRILIGNSIRKFFIAAKSPRYEGFTELLETVFPNVVGQNQFSAACSEFSEILQGKRLSSSSSGDSALKVMKIIEP